MLKNYFITAINNLIKNKLYSIINIAGLAIGLSACIIIALYVKDQYSYDKQWKDSDRIYRVNFQFDFPGKGPSKFAFTPIPAMPLLEQTFKDKIEKSARAFPSEVTIFREDAQFNEELIQIDPAFTELFQFEILSGDLENTLKDPSNIAINSEVAKRYFGSQDPVGKVLTLSSFGPGIDYKITAVYRIRGNTVLDIPMLSLFDDTSIHPRMKRWHRLNTVSYFKIKKNIDIETLKPLMPAFINRNVDISTLFSDPGLSAGDVMSVDFQNIETIHLDSSWDTMRAGGNRTVVLSFAVISVLVLLIGCINFTILTTAKATQRAREVAMRKVVGAKRKQLIVQFLGESVFMSLLAVILSLGIIEIMLPVFESMIGKTISPDYTSPIILVLLFALFLIVGISGGLYPAFILSGFRPSNSLKANQSKETKGSISLRNILVIFQFCISTILIIATIVVYIQLRYSLNRDPGYNKENLLVIDKVKYRPDLGDTVALLKNELKTLDSVSGICLSDIYPSQKIKNDRIYTHPGSNVSYPISTIAICYDYFQTYQIRVVAGRNYEENRDIPESRFGANSTSGSDSSKELFERNIIINESAARVLGFSSPEDAVGNIINSTTTNNSLYTIIGVVVDNHLYSINSQPRAEVYLLMPDQVNIITLRFKGSPKRILDRVTSAWNKITGEAEISTVFVDQLLAQEFEQEQTEMKVLTGFSLLAIFISCMGLFGSASFTVERRIKEIGLRKVMGAKVKNIVSLLLWQFSKPVLIANIIAWPVAILVMQNWLERFPYRINLLLLIPICFISGLIA
ncbi:MAG: ABC transporter permease, partial [Endomicrobiales bacterium]|nr:ABC transporter permease [Endomicrobiales bacterium]